MTLTTWLIWRSQDSANWPLNIITECWSGCSILSESYNIYRFDCSYQCFFGIFLPICPQEKFQVEIVEWAIFSSASNGREIEPFHKKILMFGIFFLFIFFCFCISERKAYLTVHILQEFWKVLSLHAVKSPFGNKHLFHDVQWILPFLCQTRHDFTFTFTFLQLIWC